MVANELTSWEQMTDASGRVYLVNRASGISKWLWQKWDLKGEVFCENILTKERRWPRDMDLNLKVQAGMANPAEAKQFLATSSMSSRKPAPQVHQQQTNPSYAHPEGSMVQNNFHNSANVAHQPQHQYGYYNSNHVNHTSSAAGANHQRSYAAAVGRGSYGTSVTQQQQQPTRRLATGFRSAPRQNGIHPGNNVQTDRSHGFVQPQMDWNYPSSQPQSHGQSPMTYGGADASSTVDAKWRNTRMDPQRTFPFQHSRSNDGMTDFRGHSKRNVPLKHGLQNGSQYGQGRFWQPSKPVKTQPMKRSGRNLMNGTDNTIYRAKPIPLTTDLLGVHSPRKTIGPTNAGARTLLKIARSNVNIQMIVAMHARDFTAKKGNSNSNKVSNNRIDEDFVSSSVVVGTNQEIEKQYLRLTSAPKPEFVRPPEILKESLKHVIRQWETRVRDYDWVCRQLKSIRQDYKVQQIESAESLETYEAHARLALENGDLGEFNTCVAQAQDLHGKIKCEERRKDEFAAYRIIYNVVVGESSYEQARLLAKFTKKERKRSATKFALRVRAAFLSNNYHQFFELCAGKYARFTVVPYLLQRLIPTMRSKALAMCVKAYSPTTIPLTFILSELGFTGAVYDLERQVVPPNQTNNEEMATTIQMLGLMNESRAVHDAVEFLTSINVVITKSGNGETGVKDIVIDCKASKLKGVQVLDHQLGLITCAGGQ